MTTPEREDTGGEWPGASAVLAALESMPGGPVLPGRILQRLVTEQDEEPPSQNEMARLAAHVLDRLRDLAHGERVMGLHRHDWRRMDVWTERADYLVLDRLKDEQRTRKARRHSKRWAALGLDATLPADVTKLWWPIDKWRAAQTALERQRASAERDRREQAFRARYPSPQTESARDEPVGNPTREAVDRVLEERERYYKDRVRRGEFWW
ncbi:hypothetical protein [Streptomyces lunalinharesii]|uniref:Uncharacterized protein n=1 Tax=Streptomyces lunalinharesii TaxID=333384 RepID=A0ABN3SUM1_9ACTN